MAWLGFAVSWTAIAATVFSVLLATFALSVVYNLYFHPLRKFPGPLLWRATYFPFLRHLLDGTMTFKVGELSEKYGPVVRINPGELAFVDADAWQQIYGHRTGSLLGADEFSKAAVFYHARGVPRSIATETRENHTIIRRQLSHGFSERSMREQEPLIGKYVDLLIKRLREHCFVEDGEPLGPADEKQTTHKPRRALDLKTWYNWTTFDIIGDLAFGESLQCLEKAVYHPWIEAVNGALSFASVGMAVKYLGLEGLLLPVARWLSSGRKAHQQIVSDMLRRRMALEGGRDDLIEGLLKKKDDWNIDFETLRANAGTLIIAGSETTATLLTGATFLLLTNPDKMKRLVAEVRSSFKSNDEITLTSVGSLTYMLACLTESMRRYPPAPIGLPREVPKGGAEVAGHIVAEDTIVACWQWAMYHSTRNWVDPFTFRPERFLPEGKDENDRHESLQPFHVGPRNCIGKNLAYAEMRLILTRILFNFDLELADDKDWLKEQKAHILWTKPPLNVYLTPVTQI